MVQYPEIEYLLLIPKVIEIILFVVISNKVYHANKSLLNRLFLGFFVFWIFYLILDCIIWITAADSPFAFDMGNIMRDVQIGCIITASFFIVLTTRVIQQSSMALKKGFIINSAVVATILVIILSFANYIVIRDNNMNIIPRNSLPPVGFARVNAPITVWTAIGGALPIIINFLCVVVLIGLARKTKDPVLKKNMLLLILGITVLPIGFIYFIVRGMIGLDSLFYSVLGHGIWSTSPLLIWRSKIASDNTED